MGRRVRAATAKQAGPGTTAGGWPVHRRSPRTLAQFEAHMAMLKVVTEFERALAEVLKPADLTLAQYNVLRILRGAGPVGLACGEVGSRLVRHDPDVTRLTDRLVKRGLIERARSDQDRRVVRTKITDAGLQILADLDEPMDAMHERQLGHMSADRLAALRTLVDEARDGAR